MNCHQITQEQAEAILQLRLQIPDFASGWTLVCKGYGEDLDEYTELDTEDLSSVAAGSYEDFELWLRGAPHLV